MCVCVRERDCVRERVCKRERERERERKRRSERVSDSACVRVKDSYSMPLHCIANTHVIEFSHLLSRIVPVISASATMQ